MFKVHSFIQESSLEEEEIAKQPGVMGPTTRVRPSGLWRDLEGCFAMYTT